eukprot:1696618-Rhodomonas_salina.4
MTRNRWTSPFPFACWYASLTCVRKTRGARALGVGRAGRAWKEGQRNVKQDPTTGKGRDWTHVTWQV